jgi:regulator of sigma E protease
MGETEYGVGWLPLGGYVKISGMIDESMDTEQMALPAQPWEFRSKPAWQRLIVMLGGIIVNVIVGIVIFWIITFKYGESFTPNDQLVNGVHPGIIGKEIGIKDGDRILALNGQKVVRFEELISSKVLLGNTRLTVLRNGQAVDLHVPETVLNSITKYGIQEFISPRRGVQKINKVLEPGDVAQAEPGFLKRMLGEKSAKIATPAFDAGIKAGDSILAVNNKLVRFRDDISTELENFAGKQATIKVLRNGATLNINTKVAQDGTLGIQFASAPLPVQHVNYGFFQSFGIGIDKAWTTFADNGKGVWKMITGKVSARNISSPIGIAKVYGSDFEWENFWRLTGLISMALAFMNLLPIPALDGGHVVFLVIEMIIGKPLGDKFMERAQVVGFAMLLTLMVFAFGNDIFKIFGK